MKRVYFLSLIIFLAFFASTSYATTHEVTITDTAFIPDSFSANVGDTVVWIFSAGNIYQSNTTSDTIPFGAPTWDSGPENGGEPNFVYVISIPGAYHYQSTTYNVLAGSFIVAPVTHTIIISDNAFIPDTFTASVGDTIVWQAAAGNTNTNNTASTSVPRYATSWSSGPLTAGQTFVYVPTAPGTYNYQSDANNNFTGSFTVIGNQTHYVIITDTAFIPNYFTANVGDTVVWLVLQANVFENSVPDTNLNAIPYGAEYWYSGVLSQGDSFSYVITTTGTYNYQSDSINTFFGTFSVGTGVVSGISPVLTGPVFKLVFQNPFGNQLNILSGQPGQITVYDIVGNKVADAKLDFSDFPVQINMAGLSAGMYLIAYSVNGSLVQTYKAVKQN